ncbi:MAG: hypothetical protein ABIA83_02690 [Patescibacteria group bacterium]
MSIYRSTPIPTFPALVGPRVFKSTLIASVFDYEVEGVRESVVPMIEFLWGRKLTTQEIYDIANNGALRVELARQLPNLPLGDWQSCRLSSWESWFEEVGGRVALCPSAPLKAPTTREEAAEFLGINLDTEPFVRVTALLRASIMHDFRLRPWKSLTPIYDAANGCSVYIPAKVQDWCHYSRIVITYFVLPRLS